MQVLFDFDSGSVKKASPARGKKSSPMRQVSPPKLKPVSDGASLTALLSSISRDCDLANVTLK